MKQRQEAIFMAQSRTAASTEPELTQTEKMLQVLTRPFPPNEIKERSGGGGTKLKYVSGASVIKRLIEATGGNYSTRLVQQQFLTIGGKDAMLVVVELEIPNLGSKQGFGVQILNERGGEDLYKGAFTDGLKKAATQFGVGLELYEDEDTSLPSVDIIDTELKTLLRNNGIMTMGSLNAAMKQRFNTNVITAEQAAQWKTELQKKAPTPI